MLSKPCPDTQQYYQFDFTSLSANRTEKNHLDLEPLCSQLFGTGFCQEIEPAAQKQNSEVVGCEAKNMQQRRKLT